MFELDTHNPEDIICKTQKPESYIIAHDPPVHHQYQVARLFTQPDLGSDHHTDEIEQAIKVPGGVSFRSVLHFLLATELNHNGTTSRQRMKTKTRPYLVPILVPIALNVCYSKPTAHPAYCCVP